MPDFHEQELERELERAWHFHRESVVRDRLKHYWSTVDDVITLLDTGVVPTHRPQHDMLNKPTAAYFEQPAQFGRGDEVTGRPCMYRMFVAAMFEAWRTRCGDDMDYEFKHFLANPVRITKRGPRDFSEICQAHLAMCEMVKERKMEDAIYELLPSYPGVVLVFDRMDELSIKDEDGLENLWRAAKQITVLVMRTGAPTACQISLEELTLHALPLERSDAQDMDVRRVPLHVAVDFIVGLEARTERPRKTALRHDNRLDDHWTPDDDRSVKRDPKTWVAAVMAQYKRDVTECPWNVESALRQIKEREARVPLVWGQWNRDNDKCPWDVESALHRIRDHKAGVPSDCALEYWGWANRWKSGYDGT